MATPPKGYGMTWEPQENREAKYYPKMEADCRDWLQALVKEPLPPGSFHEALKDGVYLCKVMNMLLPGAIPKINASKMAFEVMENIGNFLDAASMEYKDVIYFKLWTCMKAKT